ncbi:SubName: Full=Uncharacterized protein {ECO:0000313/EMBL:CCA72250.1} [Serendipita indica DSM 11827]|nr:SubName: Full=Uncharacterized protein {ECO:0000313/EMBL:CCA72250.1} [Serendipita indica DSM 11827]
MALLGDPGRLILWKWRGRLKHGRRNSYEYEDLPALASQLSKESQADPTSPLYSRARVVSNPSPSIGKVPLSAGPHRTSFGVENSNGPASHYRSGSSSSYAGHRSGIAGNAGHGPIPSTTGPGSPRAFGPYGAHARSPSSTSDIAASPFRTSFSPVNGELANGTTPYNAAPNGGNASPPPSSAGAQSKRHGRIHSRNLSIFFPRPGASAVPSIAEDGAQEIDAPETLIVTNSSTPISGQTRGSKGTTPHSASVPSRNQLGQGFKFGGRPPSTSTRHSPPITSAMEQTSTSTSTDHGPSSVPMSKVGTPVSANTTSSRRGHHHRHSLSHSFFSFMEPAPSAGMSSPGFTPQHRKQPSNNLRVNVLNASPSLNGPPLSAISQSNGWGPLSPFSATASAFPPAQLIPPKRTVSLNAAAALPNPSTQRSSTFLQKLMELPQHLRQGLVFSVAEGTVGCLLWILGQHAESLACTALAYWVVFDALGAALGVYGRLVDAGASGGSLKLPYGAKRIETVALFAQAVYLLFSAVYICKETLEHALLSAGDAGHHHHHAPGQNFELDSGPTYPVTLLWLSFMFLSLSSTLFKNNLKILDATGIYLPSVRHVLRSLSPSNPVAITKFRPSSTLLLSNPYTLFPVICTGLLISISTFPMSIESQKAADMLVAGIEAAGTAWLAWPACLVLGKVLLQTAPERSPSTAETLTATKGTMEALLRTMKEIERHPQVLHLPAPHVWQLSPPSQYFSSVGAYSTAWEGKMKDSDDDLHRSDMNGHSRDSLHPTSYSRARGRPVTSAAGGQVIVTLELHVRKELDDVECLELTRWAWQRCINALGQGDQGVSVGIVRG